MTARCRCSELSEGHVVVTCPVCCAVALQYGPLAEALAQCDLFEEVDSRVSVSALRRGRGQLTKIDEIVPVVLDGLPF